MNEKDELIEISGIVDAVIYQNEENGYTVLRAKSQAGSQMTCVGCLPFAAPGEQLTMTGSWTRHQTHGEQFSVRWAERFMPAGAEAIYEYLASHVIKGVGPATATLIVAAFGDKTLDVIEMEPEKLAGLKGISEKKAKDISESFKKQMGLRRLMEFLVSHSVRPHLAMRLYRYYGDAALGLLRDNPYILSMEHIGADFSEADILALDLGFDTDAPQRVCAAIIFEIVYNSGNGHCFIPRDKLIAATAQLIAVGHEDVEEGLDILLDSADVFEEDIAGVQACYIARLYEAETFTAARIAQMACERPESDEDVDGLVRGIERSLGITYAPAQVNTLRIAARRGIMVITGGPGTGKTTSVRAILALFDKLGLKTLLTAPTGRAAKRMSELTGYEASTVHRLLECTYSPELDEVTFRRNEEEPLDCDAVILDESSMVDITLMRALLAAMPAGSRLVMVGDADQLPAVGPGNVFSDIIRSGIVETVRLTEIFRQTSESRIVENAHTINRGEHIDLRANNGDFFFLRRRDEDEAVETIAELCKTRLPEKMGIPATDIQVLCPTRKYNTGTVNLNRQLQQVLNPSAEGKKERQFGEIVFREGDRVMQIRNNYDIMWKNKNTYESGVGIFNGDVGQIAGVDTAQELMYVDFDDRTATYSFDMLGELEHAFAMTVHKSQGSEYRAVIISAGKGSPMLLHRGVLYTAITRARELVIIVGKDEIVDQMIDNHRQTRRYSGLRARLAGK